MVSPVLPEGGYSALVLDMLKQPSPVRTEKFSSKLRTRSESVSRSRSESRSRSRVRVEASLSPRTHVCEIAEDAPVAKNRKDTQTASILAKLEAQTGSNTPSFLSVASQQSSSLIGNTSRERIEETKRFIESRRRTDKEVLRDMEDYIGTKLSAPKALFSSFTSAGGVSMALSPSPKAA